MGDRSKFIKFYESEGLAAISRALRAQAAAEAKAITVPNGATDTNDKEVRLMGQSVTSLAVTQVMSIEPCHLLVAAAAQQEAQKEQAQE